MRIREKNGKHRETAFRDGVIARRIPSHTKSSAGRHTGTYALSFDREREKGRQREREKEKREEERRRTPQWTIVTPKETETQKKDSYDSAVS
jgi:hypothetical protein